MAVYYKATRPEGRDFFSGSVDYAAALASGEPLPELPGDGEFPGPGWYHLADVPTECVGMEWPCRLFEVEPVGETFMDSAHPHKIGARSVRVLREIEAHRVFGPQGEQVVALIERCRTSSAAEADRLDAAWDASRLDAAWDASRLDAALGASWDAARNAARDAARDAALDATWDAARATARGATLGAVWSARDAAVALLCRDLIGQAPGWDQDAYDLLTGPWRDVIGPIHPDDNGRRGQTDIAAELERAVREALRGES